MRNTRTYIEVSGSVVFADFPARRMNLIEARTKIDMIRGKIIILRLAPTALTSLDWWIWSVALRRSVCCVKDDGFVAPTT